MINLSFVKEFTYVRKLNEIETVDTRTIINEMMPKFCDYIVVADLAGKPYTAPPVVPTVNIYLYLNEETLG